MSANFDELFELCRFQTLIQVFCVVVRSFVYFPPIDYRARIQVFGHVVYRHTSGSVLLNTPHVRVCSPIERQVGLVEVDRPPIRDFRISGERCIENRPQ